ncbi:MAG: helix-turn-helix domain-containing protein [Alphaproteobacteria bacterium]
MTDQAPLTAEQLAFDESVTIGAGLKAAREFLGLSLDDVVALTKVRGAYLTAIEAMDVEHLPSRPFTIGYVRAYAEALGVDSSQAVAKFRADAPEDSHELPNPIGVDNDSDPRRGMLIVAGVAVLAAILVWNIVQRALNDRGHLPSAVVKSTVQAPPISGPVVLGSALPPPVEATPPRPYVTPGLEKADPAVAALEAAAAAEVLKSAPPVARQFVARGQILGSPPGLSRLTFQAKGNVVLMIRRGDEVIDTALLKDGEAYRAPLAAGLSVDVSMPSSVDYFIDGTLRGGLTAPVTPLAALGGGAPAAPKVGAVAAPAAVPVTP